MPGTVLNIYPSQKLALPGAFDRGIWNQPVFSSKPRSAISQLCDSLCLPFLVCNMEILIGTISNVAVMIK